MIDLYCKRTKAIYLSVGVLLVYLFICVSCTETQDTVLSYSAQDSVLQSGNYRGCFCINSEFCESSLNSSLLIYIQTDKATTYTTDELLDLDIGSTFVYDETISFTIERIKYVDWHDPNSADERGNTDYSDWYRRRDGKIIVNDTYYFVHVPYTLGNDGRVNATDEQAEKWMLASDSMMDRNAFSGYYVCNGKSSLPISERCTTFYDISNDTEHSMNELWTYVNQRCRNINFLHANVSIRGGEITGLTIDTADGM